MAPEPDPDADAEPDPDRDPDSGSRLARPTDPFVTAEWLARGPDAVVADVRWYLDGRSAREAYEAGHLPGAAFVDLDVDLSAAPGPAGRHPLPDPGAFSEAMRRIGVHADSVVVAYDDTGGITAGRLWWMLDAAGVEAYVLAGGMATWTGALETGPDGPARGGTLVVEGWPDDRFVSIDEVAALAGDDAAAPVAVIDARSPERYEGQANPIDPRFGHIPGAVNVPATANLADGLFRGVDELRSLYAAAGVGPDTEVVAYCGSGVSAGADLLALRRLGHRRVRLYTGSWSEWGADPDRPVETGR